MKESTQMLNDIPFWSNDAKIHKAVGDAKQSFSVNVPYRMFPSSADRNANVIVFSQHFIDTFRLVLSNPDGGVIMQMSDEERALYFNFVDYQNDPTSITDPETLLVVIELNNNLLNELEFKTETYLDQVFNEEHTWDTQVIDTTSYPATTKLTQEAYDSIVAANELISTKTYIITLNGAVVKILIGDIVIWTI